MTTQNQLHTPPQDYYPEEYSQRTVPYVGSGSYAQQNEESFIKAVLDEDEMLEKIKYELMGYQEKINANGEPEWVKVDEPLIKNREAIQMIMRMLRFCGFSRAYKIGLVTEEEHNSRMKSFECKLANLLSRKRREWGIEKSELSMIYHMIWTSVDTAGSQAKEGHLLKMVRSTFSHQEYHDTTPQQKEPVFRNPFARRTQVS